jgi:pimeloyl-ACP methyl ester carboxylesterase
MPITKVNGVNVNYDDYGSGEPVVLVTGTGGRGREWTAHQVPALTAAGYRVVTVDNRGVPPSDTGPEGFTIDDMVADIVGLIEILGIGPCRIVGFSLGGIIVQEILLARPELIVQAVLIATRGRSDALRTALSASWSELDDSGLVLPLKYAAVVRATQYLSPDTLNNEQRIRDWLDIFEMSPPDSDIDKAQRGLDMIDNRLEEYRKITSECLVISFRDDLIVPPFFGREIAEAIPGCIYEDVAGCGHYGHLERPDAVNPLILDFFRNPQVCPEP